MKIAVVTLDVKAGKCEENFTRMKQYIEDAKTQGSELIVFGQNAVSGYLLGDQWLDDAWCQYVDSFNERLIALSDEIAIVWGNIRYRNLRRFNAAFFAYQGVTHMRVKANDSTEYMDDERYFEYNPINGAIEYKDMVFALNFGKELQIADLNINLDAHTYALEETRVHKGMILYANVTGMQNTGKQVKIMEGASYVYFDHKLLYEADYFKEEMGIVDLTSQQEINAKQPELLQAMMMGIKGFDKIALGGKLPWVVGLSGGLDSSVTAALLAMSLGKERVYGYNMSTAYNSEKTIDNAEAEANALGIHYHKGGITGMLDAMQHEFGKEFHMQYENHSLVHENMQARIRGFVLNGLAAMLGGVVVNNGNMVEAALGYCTLYGDSIGALSPIGDLSKVQLFSLSRAINTYLQKEVIPERLLPVETEEGYEWEMMPSAELKDAQKDPMKWFYHDALLEMIRQGATRSDLIKAYRNGALQEQLGKWICFYDLRKETNFIKDIDWLFSTMKKNAFKRLQYPPVISFHHQTITASLLAQFQIGNEDQKQIDAILKIS